MNTTIRAVSVLSVFLAVTLTAFGRSYLLGLSPNYARPDREPVLKAIVLFVLDGATPGDSVQVYDALNLAPVTTFRIPEGKAFERNARARLERLKTEVAVLTRFFGGQTNAQSEVSGVIDFPGFVALAGSQLRIPGERISMILVGSPFYVNPEEPSFNTTEAYPSDAHLAADTLESVFSVTAKREALAGVAVHYAYLRESFLNELHKERLARFYSLFVQEQQGVLSTFAPDINLALQRSKTEANTSIVNVQIDPSDTKIEMRHVKPRVVPLWLVKTNLVEVTVTNVFTNVIAQTNNITASFPVEPSSRLGLGIGIMWSLPGCDIDLYVKPGPDARDLYYRNHVSKEGRYFRDYRDRNDRQDYEYVELKDSVDLRQVKVWVNFFAGRSSSPTGVVIVYHQGRTYQSTFQISATSGNGGADPGRRERSRYWTEIDLQRIVGNTP
jgi:hypothetical protein